MKITCLSTGQGSTPIKYSKYLELRSTPEGYHFIHDKMNGLANILGYRQHPTHPFLIRVEPNSVVPSGMIRTLIGEELK